MMKDGLTCTLRWLLLILLLPVLSSAQEGVGLPFLKIGVGARQAGMGSVFTGVGDDIFTMFANPGGLGHLRRWQWAAAYDHWFADVYQANLSLVKQYRMLGSRKTSFGLFCTYLGMPEWDSTGDVALPANASHLVAGLSVGQRLDWLSRAISIGATVKGIVSRLDTYSSTGIAADAGMLVQFPRFRLGSAGLGLFEYGIVTMGVSMLHIGKTMTFDEDASAFPRSLCTGISLKFGKYKSWSWLLAADVIKMENRGWITGLGTEIWWRDIISARGGYRFNDRDLGDLSFGISVRWDDVFSEMLRLPTRFGDAFQIDVADGSYGSVLNQTYRGTLSHFPVAPEFFILEEPMVINSRVLGEASIVTLNWEKAFDPDPFDRVAYLVMVSREMPALDRSIRWVERDMEGFLSSALKDSLLVCEKTPLNTFSMQATEGGVYYWAVAAYDLSGHARLAKRGEEHISQFIISTSDLIVEDMRFIHSQWITTTPEQGLFLFTVGNRGVAQSDSFRLFVQDSVAAPGGMKRLIADLGMPGLGVGRDTTVTLQWETAHNGLHAIRVSAHPNTWTLELDRSNNDSTGFFVSIPKGRVTAPDTLEVSATGFDMTDIPIVPEIYFAPHSSVLDSSYFDNRGVLPSILTTFADRLISHPEIVLTIFGYIDALTGEKDESLADARADAVAHRLIELGVHPGQLAVVTNHSNKVQGKRTMPANPQDAEWVMEQNRKVDFMAETKHEPVIFEPYRVAVDTTVRSGVVFDIGIATPGRTDAWVITGVGNAILLSDVDIVQQDSIAGVLEWNVRDKDGNLVPRDRWYQYSLVLDDTLHREFMTRTDSLYIKEKVTIQRREMFGSAQFAKAEPVYQFYWDRVMDIAREMVENPEMRLQFEGHACAIGPDPVNDRLSLQRAQLFTTTFLARLRAAYPSQYASVAARVAKPVGFGEKDPLTLKLKGKREVLLGDNERPVGRYMNRRIMVLLFLEH